MSAEPTPTPVPVEDPIPELEGSAAASALAALPSAQVPMIWAVTATTRPELAVPSLLSWIKSAAHPARLRLVICWNNSGASNWNEVNVKDAFQFNGVLPSIAHLSRHQDPVGVVPAFFSGVHWVVRGGWSTPNDIVACFHDDLEIMSYGWDDKLRTAFAANPKLQLAGFFGAKGLGREDIYVSPYEPHQLVREGCYSNMVDGELHGNVVEWPVKVAVTDGFSIVMRRDPALECWKFLHYTLGLLHHAYDAAVGAWVREQGGEAMMIPVKCKHWGGRTAVQDPAWEEWLRSRGVSDALVWEQSHRKVWEWWQGKGVLPFKVE